MHARAGAAQERGTQHKVHTSVYLSYRFPVQLGDKCAEGVSNGEQSGSAILHQASNNINMSPSCRKWSGVERERVCVCVNSEK